MNIHSRGLSPSQFAALAVVVSLLGLAAIWPAIFSLWVLWTTDALKSIGMAIPPVSLVLILRAWRKQGWQVEGTWWGLLLLLVSLIAVWTQRRAVLLLVISTQWVTVLPPPSLVLLAYGSGIVLLFGGVRLYRAALFPIILLWFANPIPHAFSLLVDLPLQRASALIARSFAMHLGQPLTPDHLRLMFTPNFGMFIAPGCNGIRGAATMGFIALLAGYIYRFRWYTNALVVVGSVLLGYLFNLLRLCLLVLYYLVALHFTSLQSKAESADYVIGAILFLLATILLFTVIQRLGNAPNREDAAIAIPQHADQKRYAPVAAMVAIGLFGCVWLVRARAVSPPPNTMIAEAEPFPMRLGNYTLVRTWNETLTGGPIVYVWAQYAPPDGGTPIAIGVSPVLGFHDPLICHFVRGDHPLWEGPIAISTADIVPIDFSSALYSDGVTQSLEASTQCSDYSCSERATERTHFGFVYSRLDPTSLLSGNGQRAVPVLIRAETTDTTLPVDAARRQLTEDLRAFLASVKLDELTRPYNR